MKKKPILQLAAAFFAGVFLTTFFYSIRREPERISETATKRESVTSLVGATSTPRPAASPTSPAVQSRPKAEGGSLAGYIEALRLRFVTLVDESGEEAIAQAVRSLPPGELDMILPDLLARWAAADPDAAIAWYVRGAATDSIPGGADYRARAALLETAFRTLATRNPARAASLSKTLETEGEWQIALLEVGRAAAMNGSVNELLAGSGDLSDDQQMWMKSAIFAQWATLRPVEARGEFEKLPSWEKAALLPSLGRAWMRSEPQAAAEWWLAHADPESKPETMAAVVNAWSSMAPNQAAEWLNNQPEGHATDEGRAALAHNAFELDPEAALTWATSIQNEEQRTAVWLDLFHTLALRNPQLATFIAEQSNVPDTWRRAVAEFLSPNSF